MFWGCSGEWRHLPGNFEDEPFIGVNSSPTSPAFRLWAAWALDITSVPQSALLKSLCNQPYTFDSQYKWLHTAIPQHEPYFTHNCICCMFGFMRRLNTHGKAGIDIFQSLSVPQNLFLSMVCSDISGYILHSEVLVPNWFLGLPDHLWDSFDNLNRITSWVGLYSLQQPSMWFLPLV